MSQTVTTDAIRDLVAAKFSEDSAVDVTTDGYYFTVSVTSAEFAGKRPVARQQMVYAGLSQLISSGELHAVNILAQTPEEAQ